MCESNKCVFMFAQKKHATKYMANRHNIFNIYIPFYCWHSIEKTINRRHRFVNFKTTTGHRPPHLEKFLAKHILDSTKERMSSVLIRMDGSGYLHDMIADTQLKQYQ